MSEIKKNIFAFDLDSTLTDIDINYKLLIKLLNDEKEESKILEMNSKLNYIEVFNYFYSKLDSKGIKKSELENELKKIKLSPGMKDLLDYLNKNRDKYYLILISADNDFIINNFLVNNNMTNYFDEIYCNKHYINEKGIIQVKFTEGHKCSMCNPCQCKGAELFNFVNKIGKEKINKIYFIGDGGNDICIANKLSDKDFCFPRKGFSMHKKITENDDIKKNIKCNLIYWDNATEIMNYIINN